MFCKIKLDSGLTRTLEVNKVAGEFIWTVFDGKKKVKQGSAKTITEATCYAFMWIHNPDAWGDATPLMSLAEWQE